MSIELKVPEVGESVTEVQIGQWLKSEGESVARDETVVEIDTDKTVLEVPSPVAGVLEKVVKQEGEEAAVGEVIARIQESAEAEKAGKKKPLSKEREKAEAIEKKEPEREKAEEEPQEKEPERRAAGKEERQAPERKPSGDGKQPRVMPAARRLLEEHGIEPASVEATGPGGRILKEDVLRSVEQRREERKVPEEREEAPEPAEAARAGRREETAPMSAIRRKIARRLVDAQQTMALLTTFNEIDMAAVLDLRAQYREAFAEKYGVKLGFMSFFVKAAVDALKRFPQVNAEIKGEQIVYRDYYDVGIAIGTGKGLVVPVLRGAERMSFAEIERTIADFADRARENKLKPGELEGGTFTITNGGVYGSLLSTPIVNPPQSGVLGMHAIQERAVVRSGEIVARPMMYVALTYDHRLIDGREAVTFLKRIKEAVEEPSRMLLEV